MDIVERLREAMLCEDASPGLMDEAAEEIERLINAATEDVAEIARLLAENARLRAENLALKAELERVDRERTALGFQGRKFNLLG